MRGVRQRRPSEKVNRHRDTRSFLRAAAERPTLLREGMEVSLEFEFWDLPTEKEHRLKPVPLTTRNAGKMQALQRWPENRNAPAGAGAQSSTKILYHRDSGGKLGR